MARYAEPSGRERPALSVRNVGKRFVSSSWLGRRAGRAGAGTLALDDVSFDVYPGEMIGLLGPNGAGKTTLLKTIATLLYPTTGQVLLDGIDVYSQPERVHGRLGLVTCDERSFYWRLSGRQNLEFFSSLIAWKRPRPARASPTCCGCWIWIRPPTGHTRAIRPE
jgi:ABC-2 type transport system ATP-binding protein